jgi:hypothetical protein
MEQQEYIKRIDNKLSRLRAQYDEYARFQGQDVDELLTGILSLRECTMEHLMDMGFLLCLRVLRLKLGTFKLVADLKGLELASETITELDEIEGFFRQLESELKGSKQLLGYSPLQEITTSPAPHPKGIKGNRRLFNTFVGFFEEEPEPGAGVDLPSVDLLEFYDHVNINKIQDDVVSLVESAGGRSTIRKVAAQMDIGSPRRTVALVFMACLFLEMDSAVSLRQGRSDIFISFTVQFQLK